MSPKARKSSSSNYAVKSAEAGLDVFRGISIPPVIVGFFRGLVHALILAGIEYLIAHISDVSVTPGTAAIMPFVLLVLRTVEGLLDQSDPAKT